MRACVPELTQRWRVPANAIRDRGAIALSRALEESSTIASLALRGTAHGMCKFARASVVLPSVIHGLLRPLCCLCTAAMIATLHNCWRPPRRQQHWGCWRDRYRWPLDGVDDACSRPQWCARVVRVLFCSVSVFRHRTAHTGVLGDAASRRQRNRQRWREFPCPRNEDELDNDSVGSAWRVQGAGGERERGND